MVRFSALLLLVIFTKTFSNDMPPVSRASRRCINCHSEITPGIVSDWKKSRHARTTIPQAMKQARLKRRISLDKTPENAKETSIGCAECHTINPDTHKDTFKHNGYQVHTVVTPKDCATCHPQETREYGKNIMSHAYGNLMGNPVYHNLVDTVNGPIDFDGTCLKQGTSEEDVNLESCLFCHGSKVTVKGMEERETDMGEMSFPILTGWPNQGVGRINPDGSKGSCTACHPRHGFSIEVARKPYTCSECHKGPDVPAYKVYMVSKHGNIFSSCQDKWDFDAVPWRPGKDFSAPTCATCHISLLASESGDLIAPRTHQMNDRQKWRLFGLPYAHPHPISPDTSIIKNKAGLPLPTELTGEPVSKYLIKPEEQAERQMAMSYICLSCHSSRWVENRMAQLDKTVEETNRMTLTATKIMLKAWSTGAAKGLAHKDSIFNEMMEKKWVENWLFYANSIRFSSAMGGADYGVFDNGRWYISKNIRELNEWLNTKLELMKKKGQ